MKLSELAFACFLYENLTNYDDSYISFLRDTKYQPDLNKDAHRQALLVWLNKWGCRQFAREYHSLASSEILSWYKEFKNILFEKDKNLWELRESEINTAIKAYEALSKKIASYRKRDGQKFTITIGPTGASKILFAIRRNALIPWDEPIRQYYQYDGSSASYLNYLSRITAILIELDIVCSKNGFTLEELPKQLGRHNSTVPKLIDEYYWVTITNEYRIPTADVFQKWADWDKNNK